MRGTVEKVVFGGKGLVRDSRRVVFVPDVLPQEDIEFQITKAKKNYAVADLLKVITSSRDRVQPKCPYFGSCGGCQLQHMRYETQLQLKAEWLKESLQRIGGINMDAISIESIAAKTPYGYRKKIVLHLKAGRLCFVGRDYQEIQIKNCAIFLDEENTLFSDLETAFTGSSFDATVTIIKEKSGFALTILYDCPLPKYSDRLYKTLSDLGYLVQIKGTECTLGDNAVLQLEVAGITCSFSSHVFIQNDPDHFAHVYSKVAEKIASSNYSGQILDLYCGVGIMSLILAKQGFSVTGIEYNAEAISYAKQAMEKNGLTTAKFFAAPCEKMKKYVDIYDFKLWIVNPPRTGLSIEVIHLLLAAGPEIVFYISCEPTTLSRDLKLLKGSFEIDSLYLYDMFAQTTHFETLVMLKKHPVKESVGNRQLALL